MMRQEKDPLIELESKPIVEFVLVRWAPMYRPEISATDVVISYEYPVIFADARFIDPLWGRGTKGQRKRKAR